MEKVLFETEERLDRSDVAELLRTVSDRLENDGSVVLSAGEESIELDVPQDLTFEVKVERETGSTESELSVEFELEWDENGDTSGGSLDIE